METEPKWTPGPWYVFEHVDHSGIQAGPRYGGYLAETLKDNVDAGCTARAASSQVTEEQRATFALIAAAPDLYAALKWISDGAINDTPEMWQAVEDALAKATT